MAALLSSQMTIVACPICEMTHTLAPGQAGYEIAVTHARETSTIPKVHCGCASEKVAKMLSARTQVPSMGKKIIRKGKKIKRVVCLVTK
jgi:hypothetical protein